MTSSLEGLNNGKKYYIINFILDLSKNYLSRKIGGQIQLSKIGFTQIF